MEEHTPELSPKRRKKSVWRRLLERVKSNTNTNNESFKTVEKVELNKNHIKECNKTLGSIKVNFLDSEQKKQIEKLRSHVKVVEKGVRLRGL